MRDGGYLLMNQKERDRKALLEAVEKGHIKLKSAAERMGLSYRQAKRIWQKYLKLGDTSIVHQGRGKESHRAFNSNFKQEVLSRYQERYMGFGPTFAAEKLSEDGLILNDETLRGWLIAEGLWQKKRKHKAQRQWRERRHQFGELLQIDGSIHRWFGVDSEFHCLMVLIDDATGIRHALMAKEETTGAVLKLLKNWIERYGVPQEIYVDLKSVYVSPKGEPSIEEQLQGVEASFSVFEMVCQRLGIRVIKAYSPQAKGRVERAHAVYQDRLVKEIKLQELTSIEAVNLFLEGGFNEDLNQRFSISPADKSNAHFPIGERDINQFICWEETRTLQNDWTVSFQSKWYQLLNKNEGLLKPKDKITVRKHLDGTISTWLKERLVEHKQLTERPKKEEKPRKEYMTSKQRSVVAKKTQAILPGVGLIRTG